MPSTVQILGAVILCLCIVVRSEEVTRSSTAPLHSGKLKGSNNAFQLGEAPQLTSDTAAFSKDHSADHWAARNLLHHSQQPLIQPADCTPSSSSASLLTHILVTDTQGRSSTAVLPTVLAGLAQSLAVGSCALTVSAPRTCTSADAAALAPSPAPAPNVQLEQTSSGQSADAAWTIEGCAQVIYACGPAGLVTPAVHSAVQDGLCLVNRKLGSAVCGDQKVPYKVFAAILKGSCTRTCLDAAITAPATTQDSPAPEQLTCTFLALSIAAEDLTHAESLAEQLGSAIQTAALEKYLQQQGLEGVQVPAYTPAEIIAPQGSPSPIPSLPSSKHAGGAPSAAQDTAGVPVPGPAPAPQTAMREAIQDAVASLHSRAAHRDTALVESVLPSLIPAMRDRVASRYRHDRAAAAADAAGAPDMAQNELVLTPQSAPGGSQAHERRTAEAPAGQGGAPAGHAAAMPAMQSTASGRQRGFAGGRATANGQALSPQSAPEASPAPALSAKGPKGHSAAAAAGFAEAPSHSTAPDHHFPAPWKAPSSSDRSRRAFAAGQQSAAPQPSVRAAAPALSHAAVTDPSATAKRVAQAEAPVAEAAAAPGRAPLLGPSPAARAAFTAGKQTMQAEPPAVAAAPAPGRRPGRHSAGAAGSAPGKTADGPAGSLAHMPAVSSPESALGAAGGAGGKAASGPAYSSAQPPIVDSSRLAVRSAPLKPGKPAPADAPGVSLAVATQTPGAQRQPAPLPQPPASTAGPPPAVAAQLRLNSLHERQAAAAWAPSDALAAAPAVPAGHGASASARTSQFAEHTRAPEAAPVAAPAPAAGTPSLPSSHASAPAGAATPRPALHDSQVPFAQAPAPTPGMAGAAPKTLTLAAIMQEDILGLPEFTAGGPAASRGHLQIRHYRTAPVMDQAAGKWPAPSAAPASMAAAATAAAVHAVHPMGGQPARPDAAVAPAAAVAPPSNQNAVRHPSRSVGLAASPGPAEAQHEAAHKLPPDAQANMAASPSADQKGSSSSSPAASTTKGRAADAPAPGHAIAAMFGTPAASNSTGSPATGSRAASPAGAAAASSPAALAERAAVPVASPAANMAAATKEAATPTMPAVRPSRGSPTAVGPGQPAAQISPSAAATEAANLDAPPPAGAISPSEARPSPSGLLGSVEAATPAVAVPAATKRSESPDPNGAAAGAAVREGAPTPAQGGGAALAGANRASPPPAHAEGAAMPAPDGASPPQGSAADAAGLGSLLLSPKPDAGNGPTAQNATAGTNGALRGITEAGALPRNSHLMVIVYATVGSAVVLAVALMLLATYLYKRNRRKLTHLIVDDFYTIEAPAPPPAGHVTSPLNLRRMYRNPFVDEGSAGGSTVGDAASPLNLASMLHRSTHMQTHGASPGGNPLRRSWPTAAVDGNELAAWRPPPRLDLSILGSSLSAGQLSRGPETLTLGRRDSAESEGELQVHISSTYLVSPGHYGRIWDSPAPADAAGRVFCNPMYNASPSSNNTQQPFNLLQRPRSIGPNLTPSSRFQPLAAVRDEAVAHAADAAESAPTDCRSPTGSTAAHSSDDASEHSTASTATASHGPHEEQPAPGSTGTTASGAPRMDHSSLRWRFAARNEAFVSSGSEADDEPASPRDVRIDMPTASPLGQAPPASPSQFIDPRTNLPMTPNTRELTRVRAMVAAMEADLGMQRQALDSPGGPGSSPTSFGMPGRRSPGLAFGSPGFGSSPAARSSRRPAEMMTPMAPGMAMGHVSPASFGPRNLGKSDVPPPRHSTWVVPPLPMDSPERPPLRHIPNSPLSPCASTNRAPFAESLHHKLSAASAVSDPPSARSISIGREIPVSPTFAVMQFEEDAPTPLGDAVNIRPASRAEDAAEGASHLQAQLRHPLPEPAAMPASAQQQQTAGDNNGLRVMYVENHGPLRRLDTQESTNLQQCIDQPVIDDRHAQLGGKAGCEGARMLRRLETQESINVGQENLPWMIKAVRGRHSSVQSLPNSPGELQQHGSGSINGQDIGTPSAGYMARPAQHGTAQHSRHHGSTPGCRPAREPVDASLEGPEACGTPLSLGARPTGRRSAGRNQFQFRRATPRTAHSTRTSYTFDSPPPRSRRRSINFDMCPYPSVSGSASGQARQRAAVNAALAFANSHIQPQSGRSRTPQYKVVMFHNYPEELLRDWFHQHHIRDDQVEFKFLPTPSSTSMGSAFS